MSGKNIFNYVLGRNKNLEMHWWHRLANVLIIGTSLFLAIYLLSITFSESDWIIERGYVYSFEKEFEQIDGLEEECGYFEAGRLIFIRCGDLTTPETFVEKYRATFGNSIGRFAGTGEDNPSFAKSTLDLNDIVAKKIVERNYPRLVGYITFALFISTVWLVFLRSVVYKTILYIVRGRRKNKVL